MTDPTSPGDSTERRDVRLRRAPRIPVFLAAGAVLGLVVGLVVSALQPADPEIGALQPMLLLGVFGAVLGLILGAVAAIAADASSRRRSRTVQVDADRVEAPPQEAPPGDA